jgi:AraC-like DNA-binding protein
LESKPIAPLLVPKIYRFTDVDQFRSSVRSLEVSFTPLVRRISAEQIILNLPGCAINFTRSFPRITDGQLARGCTAVGFSMDDDVAIRFNGIDRDQSVVVVGSDGAVYNTVERVERQFASIVFTPEIADRGWPQSGGTFKMFETSPSAHCRLRELVTEVLSAPSRFANVPIAGEIEIASAIKESFLAGIDAAFADAVTAAWTANSARHFKIFQDIRAILAGNIANPIYSEELAREVGVSVRTVHDAVLRYTGMSLHRYLRLRRLWLVRQRLLAGTHSVKASALAFGFWHLGDFSKSYRFQFGETPSETLARTHKA